MGVERVEGSRGWWGPVRPSRLHLAHGFSGISGGQVVGAAPEVTGPGVGGHAVRSGAGAGRGAPCPRLLPRGWRAPPRPAREGTGGGTRGEARRPAGPGAAPACLGAAAAPEECPGVRPARAASLRPLAGRRRPSKAR